MAGEGSALLAETMRVVVVEGSRRSPSTTGHGATHLLPLCCTRVSQGMGTDVLSKPLRDTDN